MQCSLLPKNSARTWARRTAGARIEAPVSSPTSSRKPLRAASTPTTRSTAASSFGCLTVSCVEGPSSAEGAPEATGVAHGASSAVGSVELPLGL